MGIIFILKNIADLKSRYQRQQEGHQGADGQEYENFFSRLLGCFLIVFFIAGKNRNVKLWSVSLEPCLFLNWTRPIDQFANVVKFIHSYADISIISGRDLAVYAVCFSFISTENPAPNKNKGVEFLFYFISYPFYINDNLLQIE